MKEANLIELEKVHGKVIEVELPSHDKIVIREQNGEDDDILSNLADFKQSESINNFLSGVIVFHSRYGEIITPEMIKKMPLRDKYVSLIFTRIFSYGDTLTFQWQWSDSKRPDEYIEDLNDFIWDYSEEFPKDEKHPEFKTSRIKPYNTNPYNKIHIITGSGKNLRMNFLNGESEIYLINLKDSERTRNQEFRARALELETEAGWKEVINFKSLSPKDMKDLRKASKQFDEPVALTTEIENPRTGDIETIDVTALEDFFFPSDF